MYRHAIVVLSCSIRATRVREMSGGDGKRGDEITVYILYIEITVYIYIITKNNHGWRRGVAEAGGGAGGWRRGEAQGEAQGGGAGST